jgi:hypothetical protein
MIWSTVPLSIAVDVVEYEDMDYGDSTINSLSYIRVLESCEGVLCTNLPIYEIA